MTDAGEGATLPSLFRADSVRNSALNLEAIPEPVRIHAPDVGMDQIARAAGVAVGTLCRHFPTKSDFVGAVESEVVDAVADDAEALLARVLAGETLGRELTEFLSRMLEAGASNVAAKSASRDWVLPVRTPRKKPGSRSGSTAPSMQVGRHVIESASF